jgi:hypothetical protein
MLLITHLLSILDFDIKQNEVLNILKIFFKFMKNLSILCILFFLQACIGAGSNSEIMPGNKNHFPQITGIDLEGKKRELPQAFGGKLNIVAVAFKREQQKDIDSWNEMVDEATNNNPEIRFYEVPLIYEMKASSRFWVNNGMRSGVDAEDRANVITVYTKREKFLEITKMNIETIYILLVDDSGKILWRVEGPSSKEKKKSLRLQIKKYLSS